MIIDRLENADRYRGVHPGFGEAIAFVRTIDPALLEPGRREIRGADLFALLQRYQPRSEAACSWEAHRRYADVQVVLDGEERIGWAPLGTLEPRGGYDEATDAQILDGAGSTFTLRAGMFALFFPEDAHRPGMAPTTGSAAQVVKVVAKLRMGPPDQRAR